MGVAGLQIEPGVKQPGRTADQLLEGGAVALLSPQHQACSPSVIMAVTNLDDNGRKSEAEIPEPEAPRPGPSGFDPGRGWCNQAQKEKEQEED